MVNTYENHLYKSAVNTRIRSRFILYQWGHTVYQRFMVKRKDFNKWNSYELDQLIDYKKQNIFEVYSLSNKK